MNDKKLYLIIVKQSVCKACREPVKDTYRNVEVIDRWHVKDTYRNIEVIDRWHAHLMIVNGTEGFGDIIPGCIFQSVDHAKEWGEYVAHELDRPITETEIK